MPGNDFSARNAAYGQILPDSMRFAQCGAPGRAWRVDGASVEIFLARRGRDGAFEALTPLATVEPGGFFFDAAPFAARGGEYVPVFMPAPGARCFAFDARRAGGFLGLSDLAAMERGREAWLAACGDLAARAAAGPERPMPDLGAPNEFETLCLYRGMVKRAATDPSFRILVRADPRAAATRVLGRRLPEDFVVRVEFEGKAETAVPI